MQGTSKKENNLLAAKHDIFPTHTHTHTLTSHQRETGNAHLQAHDLPALSFPHPSQSEQPLQVHEA